MSETTIDTPQPEPAPEPVPPAEPAAPPAAAETPSESTPSAQEKEDRRIAQLRARLGAAERERERQAVELEVLRQQAARAAPQPETQEQTITRLRAEIRAEVEADLTARRFHEEGGAAYADWQKRCTDLIACGADAQFARMLVETPGGVKLAAALAEDPEAVERIANIRSERGRAVALGKYAATLEADGETRNGAAAAVPRAAPAVSQAPAPIRPVTGRASPAFNEYTASPQELVDHYMKQNLQRQQRR